MHKTIEPSILYFGTPAVLISTRNEDGTTNVAPMSSAWWLGWGCMIGLAGHSKTSENLLREQECVLNLPSVAQGRSGEPAREDYRVQSCA
jgi:flavin reductase (DIM6/NTAB) family NADH-FMN oxidoreductase RutF